MARRDGGDGVRVDKRHLGHLAVGLVSPWPREAGASRGVENVDQARALDALFRATGGRGLPMPGGFLLDPVGIEARVALPAARPVWKVALAFHPRFGVILGEGKGHGKLHTIEYAAEPGSGEAPRFHEAGETGRNWNELLDYLFLL